VNGIEDEVVDEEELFFFLLFVSLGELCPWRPIADCT